MNEAYTGALYPNYDLMNNVAKCIIILVYIIVFHKLQNLDNLNNLVLDILVLGLLFLMIQSLKEMSAPLVFTLISVDIGDRLILKAQISGSVLGLKMLDCFMFIVYKTINYYNLELHFT